MAKELRDAAVDLATVKFEIMKKAGDAIGNVQAYKLKNADYSAAKAYLTFEHDEFTMKATLDENGRRIPREDYRISMLNCGKEDFAIACLSANLRYSKIKNSFTGSACSIDGNDYLIFLCCELIEMLLSSIKTIQ